MIRQQAKLRREYIYRKTLEGKQRDDFERKIEIKQQLEEGTDNSKRKIKKLKSELQTLESQAQSGDVDDEYSFCGVTDPQILITSARDPSSRLQLFVKELSIMLPNCHRTNRGGYSTTELVDMCKQNGVNDLIIIHENKGEPDAMIVSHMPHGPTAYFTLANCVLRHDIEIKEPMSTAYPHLIFENFGSKLGQRVMSILKHLFPVPAEDSHRTLTFFNQNDWISFRHHVYKKDRTEIVLSEVGPRFEMRLYQIKLGTVEMKQAESEWSLRPFIRTARKNKTHLD